MHDLVVTDYPLTSPEADTQATVYASPSYSPLGQWKGFDREHGSERCDSVMDYYDQSRRRYVQNPYTAAQEPQQQQYGAEPTTDQFATPASIHRFRQATTLEETPDEIRSTARPEHDSHLYSFASGQEFGLVSAPDAQTMRYSTEIQTPETQRAQDPAQYTPYSTATVYGMGQGASPQQPSQLQYDQARYRVSTPSGTAAHQLGISQARQYFLSGQAGPPSESTSDFKYPEMSPQYHRPAHYGHAGPSALQPAVGPMLVQPTSGSFSGYTQDATGQAHEFMGGPQDVINRFYTSVRAIFSHVHSRSLHEVGTHLLELSHRLLSHVEPLGLTVDDELQHEERVQLWSLYNHAWLSTLQAQYDLTQEMVQTQQPRPVMPLEELERLGSELVRLCDGIEKHGLIDYEMGVAEDEIMDLLLKCISLLEPPENQDTDHTAGIAESSASGAAQTQ